MIHFGIICPPYPGHLNPLAALGRELQTRGHRVTFLQIPDLDTMVNSHGLNFCAIGQFTYQSGTLAETFAQLSKLSKIKALEYSLHFCQEMTEIICRDAPEAIAFAGIEVLLVDQLEPAGETVAQFLKLPFICISSAQAIHRQSIDIPPFFTSWRYYNTGWAKLRNRIAFYILDRSSYPIVQTINKYRHQWGLSTYHHLYDTETRLAHISQQPPAFDFPAANLPEYFHYVGPLRNEPSDSVSFPFERLTGQPLIYASLGSIQNTKSEIFHCISAACQDLDVQLVITHGGGMGEAGVQKLPGSPLVVEYAPQLKVLAKASLTITHAGMNTTLDSLSYGVPLVAIPITFEQPGTGARIRWTGVGEVIPLERLNVSRLQAAIQRVLTEKFYREKALKIQQSIQQAGGVKRATNIIEQAINCQRSTLVH
jgi:zeaxanthin glucosyltransferase